ncbi:MAG: zinc-ribbon domain-containing protein [Haloarculaceae archaeon]
MVLTPEAVLLAAAYLGFFAGLYLVVDGVRRLFAVDDRAAGSVTDATVVCPRCGRENDDGYLYCRNCATPLAAGA